MHAYSLGITRLAERRRKEISTAKEGGSRTQGPRGQAARQWGKKRGRVMEEEPEDEYEEEHEAEDDDDEEEEMEALYGCSKCRYNPGGCGGCRDMPLFERPKNLHWQPDKGRPQTVRPFQLLLQAILFG